MHVESSLRKWPHLEQDLIGTNGNLGGKVYVRSRSAPPIGYSGGLGSGGNGGGALLGSATCVGRCMVCVYVYPLCGLSV